MSRVLVEKIKRARESEVKADGRPLAVRPEPANKLTPAERDQVLGTADWFSLGKWPEARFNAEQIVRSGEGYAASGTLTLRGVTRPVVLKFRWTPAAGSESARLVGSAALERLAFGVGQGEWQDMAYVGNPVTVQVDIRLRQIQDTVNTVIIKKETADDR